MADYICPEVHPTDAALRCWRRSHDDDSHFTVAPNKDHAVLTRPEVLRW